jgi:hypothetical protein
MTAKKTAGKTQADKLAKMLGIAQEVDRPSNIEMFERGDDSTSNRVNGMMQITKSKRGPGKRASGYVQIAGLIPPETRDDLTVALAFDKRDLSELLTDLLTAWLDEQPSHVKEAIKAKRGM